MPDKVRSLKNNRAKVQWVYGSALRNLFGFQHQIMVNRGVQFKERTKDHPRLYDLEQAFTFCSDLALKFIDKELGDDPDGEGALTPREMKTNEEIRKLKIANDVAEGKLVEADQVAVVYERGLRALADVFDQIIPTIKKENPEVEQPILEVIQRRITDARRAAMSLNFEDFDLDGGEIDED